jgi:hypothetical protein
MLAGAGSLKIAVLADRIEAPYQRGRPELTSTDSAMRSAAGATLPSRGGG